MKKTLSKSDAPKLGKFQKVNGTIVLTAPDEEQNNTQEGGENQEQSLVVSRQHDTVTVRSETSYTDDVQYVYDETTEAQSAKLAEKVRNENTERANKARIKTTQAKVNNVVVTSSDSYSDINLNTLKADK
jgi:hypothetical protein